MNYNVLQQTLIGNHYLRYKQSYSIDTLLDYLHGLGKLKRENQDNALMYGDYEKEIEATKVILRLQTEDSHQPSAVSYQKNSSNRMI